MDPLFTVAGPILGTTSCHVRTKRVHGVKSACPPPLIAVLIVVVNIDVVNVVVPGSLNEQGVHDEDDSNDRAPRERANPLASTLGRDASHVRTCTAHGNNATRRV